MSSFYTEEELKNIGLKSYGNNVLISKKASIYSPQNISVGNNVRIDDFCIISGVIDLGSYIHISAGVYLYGGDTGIEMQDFSGISSHTSVYAVSDNFSSAFLIGAVVPEKYRTLIKGKVVLEKFTQIGAGSVVLPNVTLSEGAVVGAMSLVNKNLESWSINSGIPAIKKTVRKRNGYGTNLFLEMGNFNE